MNRPKKWPRGEFTSYLHAHHEAVQVLLHPTHPPTSSNCTPWSLQSESHTEWVDGWMFGWTTWCQYTWHALSGARNKLILNTPHTPTISGQGKHCQKTTTQWQSHCMKQGHSRIKVIAYRSILASVVADETRASGMLLTPISDVVHFIVDHQPFVFPLIMFFHLLPGKWAFSRWLGNILSSLAHRDCLQ